MHKLVYTVVYNIITYTVYTVYTCIYIVYLYNFIFSTIYM